MWQPDGYAFHRVDIITVKFAHHVERNHTRKVQATTNAREKKLVLLKLLAKQDPGI